MTHNKLIEFLTPNFANLRNGWSSSKMVFRTNESDAQPGILEGRAKARPLILR